MTPQQLASHPDIQLLDVRLADDFAAAHIEGARHNCVFEVQFPDRLSDSAPDPNAMTVVYGANGSSHEAAAAAEKLIRAGYTSVETLEGGIEAARTAGIPILTGEPLPDSPSIPDGTHSVDTENSSVEWLGRNLLNKHWGTAPVASGELSFASGLLTGGVITIDLVNLACTDLAGTDLHDVLIHHLHDDDFFDVENFPTAEISLTNATPVGDATPGSPNLRIDGDLTLRGQTHPISFDAAAGVTPEGKAAAQASFSIDRTVWGVLYGSGKFFHRLAGHLVNDDIHFQIKIVTS